LRYRGYVGEHPGVIAAIVPVFLAVKKEYTEQSHRKTRQTYPKCLLFFARINIGRKMSFSKQEILTNFIDRLDLGFELLELIFDKQGHVEDFVFLEVNPAYERQTGYKAVDLIGKRKKQLAPTAEQRWYDFAVEAVKTGKTLSYEYYNHKVKGTFETQFIPVSADKIVVLFKDITQRKDLERQVQEKERLAAIGATAGMVGHDIRNPLQAIVSDIYLLKDFLKSMPEMQMKKEVAESLEEIEKNVTYINKIVADLQDYSRQLNPEFVEVNDLCSVIDNYLKSIDIPSNMETNILYINKIVADLQDYSRTLSIELKSVELSQVIIDVFDTIFVPESIVLSINIKGVSNIKTDPVLLQRVLTNLVNNAIQAMPKGGKLDLTGYVTERKLFIVVSDTGAGIPKQVQPKLFEPMFTTKAKGQGLGLAVAKRLTQSLGGNITFESQQGKGTKFTIQLPLIS